VGTGFRPASGYIGAGTVAVVTTLVLWGMVDIDVEAVKGGVVTVVVII
jgi:hypothetical protein